MTGSQDRDERLEHLGPMVLRELEYLVTHPEAGAADHAHADCQGRAIAVVELPPGTGRESLIRSIAQLAMVPAFASTQEGRQLGVAIDLTWDGEPGREAAMADVLREGLRRMGIRSRDRA